jgi:hypothetical protein
MMQPQSLHLLAFAFLNRLLIPNQIPCHNGWNAAISPFGLLLALSLSFCSDLGLHLLPKVQEPLIDQGGCFPGRLREKTAHSCQTGSISDLTHQSRKRSCSLTLHQPKPHDHEVLLLGLGEKLAEAFGKVAHVLIHT